ncbi:class I SAM-dependent methyltransferase [Wenzhouxiangella sediminis]|uniref:Class I SAM-dependent methyltransferase n=1 Tax=Wenzhouxiangella sediminis TaxID=1792836 RepID=A0A3E1K665_9GAMM|nr:class I SAM-dependent methyltransferase [Wenzhouxiangella sediminis]RFF29523.1 class I SAM-dependent methyltransferase [Wenzhouxiangella sediminis]
MMPGADSRFDGDWLALREAADHTARSDALAGRLAERLARRAPLRVLDLGAGTGSNLRWLAPRLPGPQDWLLLDHDAELLDRAQVLAAPVSRDDRPTRVEARCADLAELSPELFEGLDLMTASALFDLVSASWLEQLADCIASAGAAALFALTVDGRRGFVDAAGRALIDDADRWMVRQFNAHQLRAKGLGRALGPAAASALPEALTAAGLRVFTERADWRLAAGEPQNGPLAQALIADWSQAVEEQSPESKAQVAAWRDRRLATLEAGRIGLYVGHVDVLALPEAP